MSMWSRTERLLSEFETVWSWSNRSLKALQAASVGLLVLSVAPAQAEQKTYTVSANAAKGTHTSIQSAIDACSADDVCTIRLVDPSYELDVPLWIEGKSNLSIVSGLAGNRVGPKMPTLTFNPSLYASVANPNAGQQATVAKVFTLSWKDISGVADPMRPAGWLMWPSKGCADNPTPKNGPMGKCDDVSSDYSTSGFQHNGMIVVKKSRDITIKGLKLVGKTGVVFKNGGIWNNQYDVLHGLVGVNLFQSLRVQVTESEFSNFFAGIYNNGRNVGGMFGTANPGDLKREEIVPLSRNGLTGNHEVQKNYFHDNWWALYHESIWDLASRIHHNVAYNNMNKGFQYADSLKDDAANSNEMNNQTGGFLYMKDQVLATDRIYNNTILRSPIVIGYGGWRAGSQQLFYNNVIRLTTEAKALAPDDWHQVMQYMGATTWNNTFQMIPGLKSAPIKTELTNITIKDATLTGIYGGNSTCASGCNFSAEYMHYGDIQPAFLWNEWTAQKGFTTQIAGEDLLMNGKPLSSISTAAGYEGKFFPATAEQGYWPWGYVDKLFSGITGSTALAHKNMYSMRLHTRADSMALANKGTKADSLALRASYLAASPSDLFKLAPMWSDASVKATIRSNVWENDNVGSSDGSIGDRGAFCYDSLSGKTTLACAPSSIVLRLDDQKPAEVRTLKAKINLIANQLDGLTGNATSGLSAFRVDSVYYTDAFPFSKLNGLDESKKPYPLPKKITATQWSGNSNDSLTFTLPNKVTNDYARFEVYVSALNPATGERVSASGIYFYRNLDYKFLVDFCADAACATPTKEAKAGEAVYMRTRIANSENVFQTGTTASKVYLNPSGKTRDGRAGKGDYFDTTMYMASMTASFIEPVIFETRGNQSIDVAGMVGLTGGGFSGASGSGSINVRPGLPASVKFESPSSVEDVKCMPSPWDSTTTFCNEVKAMTPTAVNVKVYDKFGNPVDMEASVTLDVAGAFGVNSAAMTSSVGVGATAAEAKLGTKTLQLKTDDAGLATAQLYADPGELAAIMWGQANAQFPWVQLVASVTGVTGGIDTARARLTPSFGRLAWRFDMNASIDTFVNVPVKIQLWLTKDDKVADASSAYANAKVQIATLNSASGLTFYEDAARTVPMENGEVSLKDGVVEFWVVGTKEVLLDSLVARFPSEGLVPDSTSPLLPVAFRVPPVPKYPIPSSASSVDGNCNGKADSVYINLSSAGVGGSDTLDSKSMRIHKILLTVGGELREYDSTQWTYVGTKRNQIAVALGADSGASVTGSVNLEYSLVREAMSEDTVVSTDAVDVKDGVAPRLVSAVIFENDSKASDVFLLRFNEPVKFSGTAWPFLVKGTALVATAGITVDTFELVTSGPSNTYRVVVRGNRDASFAIKTIKYTDSLKVSPASSLTDDASNAGAECTPFVPLVKKAVLPSFTGSISSTDAKGRANRLTVSFSRALLPTEQVDTLVVNFGDEVRTVVTADANWASSDRKVWTLEFSDVFSYGLTRGTEADDYGASVVAYGRRNDTASMSPICLVKDSVAAVLVNFKDNAGKPYAQLSFGDGVDSIKIKLSEPMKTLVGTVGLMNVLRQSDVGTLDVVVIDAQTWVILQDTGSANRVNSGDTVALGNRLQGVDGVMPTQGVHVSKAVVVGGDRGPAAAFYSDSTGTGSVTKLTLTFAKPLTHEAKFVLTWPGKDGKMDTVTHVTTGAIGTAGFSIDLAGKFDAGVTGAPTVRLGSMTSILTGSDTEFVTESFPPRVGFDIADSVAPIMDSAKMLYGSYEGSIENMYDTLKLWFSEPIRVNGTNLDQAIAKMVVGSADQPLTLIPSKPQFVIAADGRSGFMLFDTTSGLVLPMKGDSIRFIAGNAGGIVSDDRGAVAATKAKWTVVKAGLRKAIEPSLNVILPNPSNEGRSEREQVALKPAEGASPLAATGSNVAILIGSVDGPNSNLTVVSNGSSSSSMSWQQLDRTIGIDIPVNTGTIGLRSMVSAVIYDKYGTFVGRTDADLNQDDFNSTNTNKSGKSSIKILWDGRSATGQIVNSGVYMVRVIFFRDEFRENKPTERVMLYNKIKNIGVIR